MRLYVMESFPRFPFGVPRLMQIHRFSSRGSRSGPNQDNSPDIRPDASVLTIGNFDGVHLGHRALIQRTVEAAREADAEAVVVTFDPHPQRVLRAQPLTLLSSLPQRLRLFEQLGADAACVVPFTAKLAELSAEQFLESTLLNTFTVRGLVIGYDFAFGHNREGTTEVLKALSARHGFALELLPAVVLEGEIVSSTRIRAALGAADFPAAERLLGRPWSVLAPVEQGEMLGRVLGFPTINQPAREPLPIPFGIYASWAVVEGQRHPAASSFGIRPTIDQTAPGHTILEHAGPILETHLLDFSGDLYGQWVEVIPVRRLREERKFPSLDALKAQIAEDCREARRVLAEFR
jgi:riboflavin kinase/FMN adenylyltransferase